MTTNSPAEIVLQYLLDYSPSDPVGNEPDADEWPIYFSQVPTEPDNTITVFDTAGRGDGRLGRTREVITHPGIQVRVRGATHAVAWAKVLQVIAALDAVQRTNVVLEGKTYQIATITRQGTPMFMGPEPQSDRTRLLFSINALLSVREL